MTFDPHRPRKPTRRMTASINDGEGSATGDPSGESDDRCTTDSSRRLEF